jgi:superfamily II DNA or RNA helicase
MSQRLPLRDYQRAALDAIHASYARGVSNQLLSLPTGAGKTHVAAYAIEELAPQSAIFLVHRDELVKHTVRALVQVDPLLSIGVVKAQRNELGAAVTVASVQTLSRDTRLRPLIATLGRPRLLIVDEAHHAVADTYRRVHEEIDADLTIGLTATAYRSDQKALGDVFQEVVYHIGMLPLIARGQLANLVGIRIDTDVDLDDVHVVAGEFQKRELSHAVDRPSRNLLVVDAWKQYAQAQGRRRTLAFCVDTAHAEHLKTAFLANGVKAEVILGRTPTEERERIFGAFEEGSLPVLINCMVLTEGWDSPQADCALMCRPTKSLGLYVQCVGRLARAYPGKRDALVVDFVDNSSRHQLVTLPTLAGQEAEGDDEGGAPTPDRRRVGERTSLLDMAQEIGRARHLRAVEVNLFGESPYLWREVEGRWMTSTGDGSYLTLWPQGAGYLPVRLTRPSGEGSRFLKPTVERLFDRPVDAETARALAEDLVPKNRITDREATWRDGSASDAQRAFARKLGIKVLPGWTKGEVAAAIDQKLFVQTLHRLP